MKKILLAIFGAAFLMVGCTKEIQTYVEDLNTRVSALEDKVAQNEAAITALRTAVNQGVSIASVTENADGWLITLTDGNKYQLNHGKNGTDGTNGTNGKDGKDGDSWITSVAIEGDIVVITTAQGELRIPYAKAFRLVIAQDVAVDPGIVKVPYSVENGTAATTVDAFASAPYIAEVTAETVDITVPTPAVKGNVLVWAEDGTLGKASIKKINLEGPYATVSEVTPVAGVGGTIEVPVVANVEISVLDETEDWLSYKETKATNYTVVLTATANTGDARSSSVKVVRKSDNTVLETITIAQKAVAPVTLNGALEYDTIQEALTAAEALTEGEAVITLANKTFEEAVKIDGAKIAVPVTIDGGAKAKIVGGIEIYKNAATIKGLEITVATTSLTTLPGEYRNSAADGFAFGIQVNVPGYGATIKDNVINNDVKNATAIYFAANDADAAEGDLVTGNVLNCGAERGMQVYGSIKLIGNTIVSSKYPIRLGRGTANPNNTPQGTTKVVIAGNKFEADKTTANAIDVHATLTGCDITLGDGTVDNNLYNAFFTNRVTSLGTDNTWHPEITAPYANAGGNVTLNENYKFATIQAAVDAAAAITTGTATITVPAATVLNEDVKIDGAKLQVPIVIDGTAQSSTVNGSFEIKGAEATIRNFTIVPTENSKTALAADGWYTNAHTTGVQINGSGFGAVLENLTINTSVENSTGIWVGYKQGEKRDVIRNVTINGTGAAGRKIQAYDSILEIANCTFNGSYSYGIRIGGTGGSNVILKANRFNSAGNDGAAVGFQFNALGESTVVLGDGTKNDNTQDGSYRSLFGAGNEWLFHNNNFFYPDLKYAAANNDLIVNETLGRVWAHWDEYDNTWDDAILPQATGNNWARHGVASGRYLYVPIAQGALANSGIAVFDVLTGEFLYKITEGIEEKGHFKVCSTAKLGETVYVASMGMQSNGTPLVVYKLTTAAPYFTKAEKVLEYTIPAGRLGDTMTGWGTNEEGVLAFVDYAQSGEQRASYLFQVKDGAITNAAEPSCPPYMNTATGNKMLGIYVFSGPGTVEGMHYALLTGNNAAVVRGISKWNNDGWYCTEITSGVWADYATAGIFKHSVLDPTIMTIGGKQHIVYVTVNGKYASLRAVDVSGDGGLLARIYAIGDEAGLNARTNAYALAYPGNPAHAVEAFNVGNNGTGFVTTTVIDEVTYIVAAATEVGWSCFKVNE